MRDLTSLAEVTGQWETATSVAALVLPTSGSVGAVGGARTQAAVERFRERKAVLTGADVKNSGSSGAVAGEAGEAGVAYTPSANGPKGTGQALREVEVSSGGKGSWTKELNKPESNTIYKIDGNKTYQTDSPGRVDKVESNLSLTRNDRNTYQQCVAGKCGVSGDEGGHLIASVFNGAGERLNLLPMNGNLNKGAWKAMENTWTSALKQGQTVV
ncbi:DNA/RNA non-specific endonuclease [Pseudomonas putida]|nr:DNA/RNA non-specific endonuclease [Pseudomonas putida]